MTTETQKPVLFDVTWMDNRDERHTSWVRAYNGNQAAQLKLADLQVRQVVSVAIATGPDAERANRGMTNT